LRNPLETAGFLLPGFLTDRPAESLCRPRGAGSDRERDLPTEASAAIDQNL